MDEQPKPAPAWTWPERSPDGTASPTSSGGSATPTDGHHRRPRRQPAAGSPDSRRHPAERQQDQLPGEDDRSFAIRSNLVTLASTLISTSAAFGLKLDGNQTASLMSLVTGLTTLGALILAGRKQQSSRRRG